MAPTTLIFDLDGTLWDSREFYAKIIALAGGNFNRSMQCLKQGLPVAQLLRRDGISPQNFSRLVTQTKSNLRLYPDVRNVLQIQKASGVSLGVVTNLPGWIAQPMLHATGLSQFFSTMVDWNRCRIAKPSPKPLLIALGDLAVSTGRDVWYVGDSIIDGQAANAAKISFAWASYGYSSGALSYADKTLRFFSDILKL